MTLLNNSPFGLKHWLCGRFAILFIALFAAGFTYFCLLVNTIGYVGDVWIIVKLSGYDRGTFIQDIKNGIEVWKL